MLKKRYIVAISSLAIISVLVGSIFYYNMVQASNESVPDPWCDFDDDTDIDENDLWHFCGSFIDYYKTGKLDPTKNVNVVNNVKPPKPNSETEDYGDENNNSLYTEIKKNEHYNNITLWIYSPGDKPIDDVKIEIFTDSRRVMNGSDELLYKPIYLDSSGTYTVVISVHFATCQVAQDVIEIDL